MNLPIATEDSVYGCRLVVPVVHRARIPILLVANSWLRLLLRADLFDHVDVFRIDLVIPHLLDGAVPVACRVFTCSFDFLEFTETFGYHICIGRKVFIIALKQPCPD